MSDGSIVIHFFEKFSFFVDDCEPLQAPSKLNFCFQRLKKKNHSVKCLKHKQEAILQFLHFSIPIFCAISRKRRKEKEKKTSQNLSSLVLTDKTRRRLSLYGAASVTCFSQNEEEPLPKEWEKILREFIFAFEKVWLHQRQTDKWKWFCHLELKRQDKKTDFCSFSRIFFYFGCAARNIILLKRSKTWQTELWRPTTDSSYDQVHHKHTHNFFFFPHCVRNSGRNILWTPDSHHPIYFNSTDFTGCQRRVFPDEASFLVRRICIWNVCKLSIKKHANETALHLAVCSFKKVFFSRKKCAIPSTEAGRSAVRQPFVDGQSQGRNARQPCGRRTICGRSVAQ